MIKKFFIAMSLAVILALMFATLALAAGAAPVVFTTDIPCTAMILVASYTNPSNLAGQTASGTTPWTLDTFPSTSVTFFYPASVTCNGVSYNFVSVSPGNPIISGLDTVTTTVTGHYTLSVPDVTPPVWTVPASFSVEATGSTGAVVSYAASVSDPDDAVSSQSCSPAAGATFALGITTVNCTATDTHNNTGTASFKVTVVDTTPPGLTLPSNMTVNALNASGAPVNFIASANDLVDGSLPVTCLPASSSIFSFGTTIVNCSATDSLGNTANSSFTITVVDNGLPVLTLPSNMTVNAVDASGAPVSFTASANDLIDGSLAVTCLPASGSIFPFGITIINCSATDSHGNTANGSFTITVVDTTLPTLTLPANMTVAAVNASGALVSFTASANDAIDGPLAVTCFPTSGSVFPIGMTTVNCSATDSHGNTANGSFLVTVTLDTAPPVLTLPANMTVDAVNASGSLVNFTASANDAVDGPVAVSCLPVSGSIFALGTTTVNCSATDSHSNTASGSFTITVVDTTPPALTLPTNITVTAANASGALVSFTVAATDLVDGPVAATCSPASGSLFPIGTSTVNCSATDSHGNSASGSFTVSVQYATAGNDCKGVPGHQILQPINSDGSSEFNAGSTVPAKFRVCGSDGNGIGTPGVVTNFRLIQIVSKDGTPNVDQAVTSTTPDAEFRSGSQQWIFNIDTKDLNAGNTYVYLISLNDGSVIQFQFVLK